MLEETLPCMALHDFDVTVTAIIMVFMHIQNGSIFQEEYQSFLKRSMNSPLNIKTQLMYAQHCYDATWTLARALNSTIEGTYSYTQQLYIYRERIGHSLSSFCVHLLYCVVISASISVIMHNQHSVYKYWYFQFP